MEEGQLEGEGDPPPLEGGQIGWTPNAYLAREYIWGPGDSHAGVDELLVQFDQGRVPWWVIQDGGGDVVAVVETPGTSPSSTDPSRVAGQWTFDAYGAVQSFDLLHDHPPVHCGHKGLFFDRLDVGVVAVGTGGAITENDRLTPGAELSGYARNRHYSPRHGRWVQMDPNATAMVLIESSGEHGRASRSPEITKLDLRQHFGDGMNSFQYLGSGPWDRHDETGLSFGFDGGMIAKDILEALVTQYGENMEYDLDWTMDWGQSDSSHSRLDNRWVTLTIAEVAYRNALSYATFGISDLYGLLEDGADAFADWVYDDGTGDTADVGPAMAGVLDDASRAFTSPMRSILKHGKEVHQRLIVRLIKKAKIHGADWWSTRVNKELIDPRTGKTISKLRPDYFSYVKQTNTVILGEAAATTSVSAANTKLSHMEGIYRKLGYSVKRMPVQVP